MTFLEEQRGGSTSNAMLIIRNERAIRIDHFGRLLTDLEKDYRKFGGGTLAVGRVANGSLHFEFHELVATSMSFIPYIKAVIDLTVLAVKGGTAAMDIFGKSSSKRRGARTVENLARIAVSSNAKCSLEYRSGLISEHLTVTVDPPAGQQIVAVANAGRRAARLEPPPQPDRLAAQLSRLSERAIALRETGGAEQDELRSLIQIVVDTLRRAGAESQVHELVRRLRHQRLDDVAQLFEDALRN